MIVNYLYLEGVLSIPVKTYSISIIYANAELTLSVPF